MSVFTGVGDSAIATGCARTDASCCSSNLSSAECTDFSSAACRASASARRHRYRTTLRVMKKTVLGLYALAKKDVSIC